MSREKEKILDVGKVSTKFLVSVPKEVRERLNLKVGDKIIWIDADGKIVVRKA